jgi:ATP-dependent Lhr-like helicase
VNLDDLRRDQVEVVEEPLGGRRDVVAVPHVLGERLVGLLQDAGVVPQPRINAAGVPPLRIDREVRREGERPLIEALRAERFLAEGLVAGTIVIDPGVEEQVIPLFQNNAKRRSPVELHRNAQLCNATFATWDVANTTSVQCLFSPLGMKTFHPAVEKWFSAALGQPTEAQSAGWASIRQGRHTLIAAPTGSGKTLAAFLTAIDDLLKEGIERGLPDETRVLYVSPLKALSTDIDKNLAAPRAGIREVCASLGITAPDITSAVRTGDTPAASRAAMLRKPPHILITTPESLYLLLTSEQSRQRLRSVRTVIVDEIHAVIGTRRGAHLALSLERLASLTSQPPVRIGLSATQRPVEMVANFLAGCGPHCTIIDQGHRRDIDLAIELPGSPLDAVMAHEVWLEYYDRLAVLARGHRTTLVFVNTRKMAERVARQLADRLGEDQVAAHHGSLSKERRLEAEQRLKSGALRVVVATASLELGIDIGSVDLVCQIGSPRRIATLLQRVGRAGHNIHGTPKGRVCPETRDDLVECVALLIAVRRGELDRLILYDAPLDVLAQQIVAEVSSREWREDDLFDLARRAWPYRDLTREDFHSVITMLAAGFTTRRGRRSGLIHRDEVQQRVVAKRSARMTAITSGGAIPDVADYRVVLDPDETFLGTLNEDFAIESNAGDIFQLGNTSWRILQVAGGVVRVADAHGAPPTIPFWLGEAPGRTAELSAIVSNVRQALEPMLLARQRDGAIEWLVNESGASAAVAAQVVDYLAAALQVLGALPSHDTLILERFFDDSGGMQLVLHAPFGSRVNRAWALALRKRFCRQFNFELQAAATEEGLLLSLGPQHAFPLADVFRYLHPSTVRGILIQAFLDAPVFQTRWRWNATISLAVTRMNGGRKVPAPLQRMRADDLLASAFPDAAACLENIPGDRQVPDHPLVAQTVRDCLEEAMDLPRLLDILTRIHDGSIRCVARDTVEPSALSHEIINARPYAFLDDAPLEERRAHAVQTRRATDDKDAIALGVLDADAIAVVCGDAWPDPRDADEMHDALVTAGFLTAAEARSNDWAAWLDQLAAQGRATQARQPQWPDSVWVAAERLPEMQAAVPVSIAPVISAPASRTSVAWTADAAVAEILRGRLAMFGPITPRALGSPLGLDPVQAVDALTTLESDGAVLRGWFSPGATDEEWCDRRILARIHRATLQRLRAEIQPVTAADFMRFLFEWQHVTPTSRVSGIDGLRMVIAQLDGFELAADAWDKHILPARVSGYDSSLLDLLCYGGEAAWARLTPPPAVAESALPPRPIRTTPVALLAREHLRAWRAAARLRDGAGEPMITDFGRRVLDRLASGGAQFAHEIASALSSPVDEVQTALAELVWAGVISSDGFSGLRAMWNDVPASKAFLSRTGRTTTAPGGRWSILTAAEEQDREQAIERYAVVLLQRYGIVCRRLLVREPFAVPWRDVLRVYRRMEARGEVRGGRFVSGLPGEQFALPEAVELARHVRRTPPAGDTVSISAADPLNLCGIITAGDRVTAIAGTRITFRDGVPLVNEPVALTAC